MEVWSRYDNQVGDERVQKMDTRTGENEEGGERCWWYDIVSIEQ